MHLLVLAHEASWDKRYQVSSLAASAASQGDRVDLALFFAALAAWVGGGWDRLDPAPPLAAGQIESLGFPPLTELLAGARATGRVRLFACSASVRLLGLDAAAVQERVDLICGWSRFARMIAEADRVVTW